MLGFLTFAFWFSVIGWAITIALYLIGQLVAIVASDIRTIRQRRALLTAKVLRP